MRIIKWSLEIFHHKFWPAANHFFAVFLLLFIIDFKHRLKNRRYLYFLTSGIILHQGFRILKIYIRAKALFLLPLLVLFIKIIESYFRFLRTVRISNNHGKYFLHHLRLLQASILLIHQHLGIVLAQIRIQPNPNCAFLIHTHLLLCQVEPPYPLIQTPIPWKHSQHAIQVVWAGNILELAQPAFDVLKVNSYGVGWCAEFLPCESIEVMNLYDVWLILPPLKRVLVIAIVVIWSKLEVILVQERSIYTVPEDRVGTQLSAARLCLRLPL